MRQKLHAIVALLAIGLQGTDALVGAAGHSHLHRAADSCSAELHGHARGACAHHHDAPPAGSEERPRHDQSSDSVPAQPHDDCALCRHFSQPVALAAFDMALAGSERIDLFVPRLSPRLLSAPATIYAARGPPCLCG